MHGDSIQTGKQEPSERPTVTLEHVEAVVAEQHHQAGMIAGLAPAPSELLFPPPDPGPLPSNYPHPYLAQDGKQNRVHWFNRAPPSSGPLSLPLESEFNLPVTTWVGSFFDYEPRFFGRAMDWSIAPYRNVDDIAGLPFTVRSGGGTLRFVERVIRANQSTQRVVQAVARGSDGRRVLTLDFAHPERAVALRFVMATAAADRGDVKLSAHDQQGTLLVVATGLDNGPFSTRTTGLNGVIGVRHEGADIHSITLEWGEQELFILDIWCETFPHSVVFQGSKRVQVALAARVEPVQFDVPLPFHCDLALAVLRGFALQGRDAVLGDIATAVQRLHASVRVVRVAPVAGRLTATVEVSAEVRGARTYIPANGPSDATVHYALLAWDSRAVDLFATEVAPGTAAVASHLPAHDAYDAIVAAGMSGVEVPEWDADDEQHRSIGAFRQMPSGPYDPASWPLASRATEGGAAAGLLHRISFDRPVSVRDGLDRFGVIIHGGPDSPFDGGGPFVVPVFNFVPLRRVVAPGAASLPIPSRVFWVMDSVCEGTKDDRNTPSHGATVLTGRSVDGFPAGVWMNTGSSQGSPMQLLERQFDMVLTGLAHVEFHPHGFVRKVAVELTMTDYDGSTLKLDSEGGAEGEDGQARAVAIPYVVGVLNRDRFVDDWLRIETMPVDDGSGPLQYAGAVRNVGRAPVRIDGLARMPFPAPGAEFTLYFGWRADGVWGFATEEQLRSRVPIFLDPGEVLVVSCTYLRSPTTDPRTVHELTLLVVSSSIRQRTLPLVIRGHSLATVQSAAATRKAGRTTTGARRRVRAP
jgi:hypothetical protein